MPSSGTKRKSSPGFTLVGDAAHLMTPFAGQGVGIEMKDTHILAKEITTTSNALAAAVSRSLNLEICFKEGGFGSLCEQMEQMKAARLREDDLPAQEYAGGAQYCYCDLPAMATIL
ncbi:hypothetical protein RBB50_004029 [Rhinocladiella similis]